MALIAHLKPRFWDHVGTGSGPGPHMYNFRRIWKWTVLVTLGAALIPLSIMTYIDYRVSRDAMLSDILLRTARLTSNTKWRISSFLVERKAALDFANHNDPFASLVVPARLSRILVSLQKSFGGFVDLGVIDHRGVQVAYAGPYDLFGRDYSDADWFRQVGGKGIYVSEVFSGFRNVPHMVIAVKHALADGRFYVLRATLDAASINDLLSGLEIGTDGDAFLINREGVLQTGSRMHGKVLEKTALAVPAYADQSQVRIIAAASGQLVLGYAYLPETPFILMITKQKQQLMAPWNQSRTRIIVFLVVSTCVILIVVLGGTTFLVNQIYLADQRRLAVMHQAEYANKMASLGRLSAGVAHEINNPLAVINEKAGLIKDLFVLQNAYAEDSKLMALVDSVLSSVDRCAEITRRLLNFARRSGAVAQEINLAGVVREVLDFMGKEAEYRSIDIQVDVDAAAARIRSDPGRLQEILLNLFTNAFAAMADGGRLTVNARPLEPDQVVITVTDTGHGIPAGDLERVFEPFFSTRIGKGGTGLGLSITYGLVQELGGRIQVRSTLGEGTSFILTLPVHPGRAASDNSTANDSPME